MKEGARKPPPPSQCCSLPGLGGQGRWQGESCGQHANLALLVLACWGIVWCGEAAGSRGTYTPAPGPQGQQHCGQDQGGSEGPKHHHSHQAGLTEPGFLPPYHLLHGDAQQTSPHAVGHRPRGRYHHSRGGPQGDVCYGGRVWDR